MSNKQTFFEFMMTSPSGCYIPTDEKEGDCPFYFTKNGETLYCIYIATGSAVRDYPMKWLACTKWYTHIPCKSQTVTVEITNNKLGNCGKYNFHLAGEISNKAFVRSVISSADRCFQQALGNSVRNLDDILETEYTVKISRNRSYKSS